MGVSSLQDNPTQNSQRLKFSKLTKDVNGFWLPINDNPLTAVSYIDDASK